MALCSNYMYYHPGLMVDVHKSTVHPSSSAATRAIFTVPTRAQAPPLQRHLKPRVFLRIFSLLICEDFSPSKCRQGSNFHPPLMCCVQILFYGLEMEKIEF
jgi:hypothetical protein